MKWDGDKVSMVAELNGQCSTDSDCKGSTILGQPGLGCCQGKCQYKKKDWTGMHYCPHECVGDILKGKGSWQLRLVNLDSFLHREFFHLFMAVLIIGVNIKPGGLLVLMTKI